MKKRYIVVIIFIMLFIVVGIFVFFNLNGNKSDNILDTNINTINEETKQIVHLIKGEIDTQIIEFDVRNDLDEETDYTLYAKDLEGSISFGNIVWKDSSTGNSTYSLFYKYSPEEVGFHTIENIPAHSTKHVKLTFYIDKAASVENGQYIKFEICSDTKDNVSKRALEIGAMTQEQYDFGVKIKEVCEMLGKDYLTQEEVEKYIGPIPEE